MKAALRKKEKIVDVIELDIPVISDDEVLVKVRACGICGSDIVRISEENEKWNKVVLGHEFAGEIIDVGRKVINFKPGDRVSAAPLLPCHECSWCGKGLYSLCQGYSFIGSRINGAMSEYLAVPAQNLVPIGDLSYERAAMLEPVTVCLHPILRLGNLLGKEVVVTGAGTIGLLAIQIFKAMGVKTVIVSDVVDAKLDMAKTLGADVVVNAMEKSLEQVCKARLEDGGADIVFESSGANAGKKSAIQVCRGRGRVLLVGTSPEDITFKAEEFEQITRKEIDVTGSWMNYSAPFPGPEWSTAVWMINSGLIQVDPIITHKFAIDDVQQAYDVIFGNKELWAKVMLTMNGDND